MVYIGGKVSKGEAAQRDEQDRKDSLIEDAVKRAAKNGSARSTGTVIHASEADLKDTKGFTAHTRGCVRPHYRSDSEGNIVAKVYTHAEFEAVKQGYYCVRCDDLQKEPDRDSAVWVPGEAMQRQCEPARGRGCGFPRGTEAWRALPFVIRVLPPGPTDFASKRLT